MADNKTKQQDTFTSKVLPIMDRVRDDLSRKQADEMIKHQTSFGSLLAGAAGPDGGMAAMDAYNDRLYYIGKWNSKTVDDYIAMVKAELKRKNIVVDATMEKRMIDHLIQQKIPKSSAEYILRKSAEGSLFHLPQRARSTSLEHHINKEAERKYSPSMFEEAASGIGSWIINATTTAGAGGFLGQFALDAGVEATNRHAVGQQSKYLEEQRKIGKQEVASVSKKKAVVPKWMLSQMGFDDISYATDKQLTIAAKWANDNGKRYRDRVSSALNAGQRTVKASGKTTQMSVSDATYRAMQYEAFANAIRQEQTARKNGKDAVHFSNVAEAEEQTVQNHTAEGTTETNQPNSSNEERSTGDYKGWDNLFSNIGLNGMGDTMQHLGVTLAMLPDMLLGVFTGRTKSIGLNSGTMMPLAALIGGTFIRNPLLKIPLLLYGGASLLNRTGQESLSEYRKEEQHAPQQQRYKRYEDEALGRRLRNPQIEGNIMLVDIDNVPRLVTLPTNVIDAYHEGALTVNTIANRILSKVDQAGIDNQQGFERTSERYEQSQDREQVRGIR